MAVVHSKEELELHSRASAVIVQPLVDCGEQTVKAYVVGSLVSCQEGSSPSKLRSPAFGGSSSVEPQTPASAAAQEIATVLRRILGLTLFGFDLVPCRMTGEARGRVSAGPGPWMPLDIAHPGQRGTQPNAFHFYTTAGLWCIVDINYFPSFKGVPGAAAALHAALLHAAGAG